MFKINLKHFLLILGLSAGISTPSFAQNGGFKQPEIDFPSLFPESTDLSNKFSGLSEEKTYLDGVINNDDYFLSSGDIIELQLLGFNFPVSPIFEINTQGLISIPQVGSFKVDGISITEAEQKLKKELAKKLNFDALSIILTKPKNIKVQLFKNTALVSEKKYIPLTRVFTLLVDQFSIDISTEEEIKSTSAGVDVAPYKYYFNTKQESPKANLPHTGNIRVTSEGFQLNDIITSISQTLNLRDIQVIKVNGDTLNYDLYGFIYFGQRDQNAVLNDGDRLIVNELTDSTPTISISGGVKQSVQLPFKKGDNFDRLVSLAGGFTNEVPDSLRIQDLSSIKTVSINDLKGKELKGNTHIIAPKTQKALSSKKSVEIVGNIQYPGFYFIDDTDGVSQAITKAGGMIQDVESAYIIHNNSKQNQNYDFESLLLKRNSTLQMDEAEYFNFERYIQSFYTPISLSDSNLVENILLKDGDKIFLPDNPNYIIVFGQVQNPGTYAFQKNMTVEQSIALANGKTASADNNSIYVIRGAEKVWLTGAETVKKGDIIFVNRKLLMTRAQKEKFEIEKMRFKQERTRTILQAAGTLMSMITTYYVIRNN